MGKIKVEELAAQMGIGSKEVLFLLQSIGVDVKSPQAALDESTVLAILEGKTHAPKQLIVRDAESKAFRPQKSALSRIKIVEKTATPEKLPEEAAPPRPAATRPAEPKASAKPAPEPARTAVVAAEPEPEQAPKTAPPVTPRKIVLPPRPTAPARPAGPAMSAGAPRPSGPRASVGAPSRPGPSVYRPAPGGPGARPLGGPARPGMA